MDTVATPTARISRSPHSSIKVLPTTPGSSARLPSNVRLVRGPGGAPRVVGEDPGPQSAFNEAAPAPLLYSPSSSLVFARRKRSAFKGPMLHTSNLMATGGTVHSPLPCPMPGSNDSTGRSAARKSQIIEEEEDVEEIEEEIEEVEEEEFETTAVLPEDEQPTTEAVKTTAQPTETGSPSTERKPALEPAPELDSSPIMHPLSPSLQSEGSEMAAAIAAVISTNETLTPDDVRETSADTPPNQPPTSSD